MTDKQERVYLVATGETVDGRETYTRHDSLPPMCDFETLFSAPPAQPADIGNTISSKTPEPNEENPYVLWREIHRLRTEVQGPSGFATWQDAAVAERVRRVKAEQELRAAQPAPAQEPQPVSNTDELPQRLSDERAAFEAWHNEYRTQELVRRDDTYYNTHVRCRWEGWQARAIESALQPGWRDIESAPKDELILVGPTKRMGICVAMHHSRDGWVTETTSEWVTMYTPTHWMPLPPAPKATK